MDLSANQYHPSMELTLEQKIIISMMQSDLTKRDLYENAEFDLHFYDVLDRCGLVQNALKVTRLITFLIFSESTSTKSMTNDVGCI